MACAEPDERLAARGKAGRTRTVLSPTRPTTASPSNRGPARCSTACPPSSLRCSLPAFRVFRARVEARGESENEQPRQRAALARASCSTLSFSFSLFLPTIASAARHLSERTRRAPQAARSISTGTGAPHGPLLHGPASRELTDLAFILYLQLGRLVLGNVDDDLRAIRPVSNLERENGVKEREREDESAPCRTARPA